MRAKICGVTQLEDALYAIAQGAWAIGFNFYPKSPRYINKNIAKMLIKKLPPEIIKVGVFVGASYATMAKYQEDLQLNLVQIYEDLKAPQSFKSHAILALQAEKKEALPSLKILQSYGYLLLDAPGQSDGLRGGTGRMANWELARHLAGEHRVILAGGLNANNVTIGISAVDPYAVDVASGIETKPGIKNKELVREFLTRCHHG